MQTNRASVLVLLVGVFAGGVEAGEILNIGDKAPLLVVSDWVKGEKIERFEMGTVYVVEFWATWCGPCRVSIPHLSELARLHRKNGVRFIGVDVWEHETEKVRPFVEEMGEKMDYSVALDSIPASGDPNDGAMAQGWMKAAEENGIPTAFVVRDGKIAWIGHPMDLDEPLTQIVSGEWKPGSRADQRLAIKIKERKASDVRTKVFPIFNTNDFKATIAAIDELTSGDPELAEEFAWLKFASLCQTEEVEKGLELGERLFLVHKDNPYILNNYFWNVITPRLQKTPDPRVARLALRATTRAVELTKGENPNHLDTMAEAQFRTGDIDGAIATETKALHLVEAAAKDPAAPQTKAFLDRIERYRQAASARQQTP